MARLLLLVALYVLSLTTSADARWSGTPGANADWYKAQHNAKGEWCCDEADGHSYFGDWKINEDGSVTVEMDGKPHVLPPYMVLSGSNPTGHAVWWYIETGGGHRDYCFAPGTLS